MKSVVLSVDGMMCGMCEAHVCDAVRRAVQVKKIQASHAKNLVEVVCEDDTDEQAIADAIEGQGYRVSSSNSRPYTKKGLFSFFKRH